MTFDLSLSELAGSGSLHLIDGFFIRRSISCRVYIQGDSFQK